MNTAQLTLDIMRAYYGRQDWEQVCRQVTSFGWEKLAHQVMGAAPFLYHALNSSPNALRMVPLPVVAKLKQAGV